MLRTTPSYTRAMKSALRAMEAMDTGAQVMEARLGSHRSTSKVAPPPLAHRSKIGAMVAAGEFVTMVEIVPPKGIDCTKEIEGAAQLHKLGVDAINVPIRPRKRDG